MLEFHDLFGADFLPLRRELAAVYLARARERLQREGILAERDGRTVFAGHSSGIFAPALILAPLESLLWVYHHLTLSQGEPFNPAEFPAEGVLKVFYFNDFLRKLQLDFAAGLSLGLVHRSEAASKSALAAALENLRQRKLISIYQTSPQRKLLLRAACRPELDRLCEITTAVNRWLQPGTGG